MLFELISYFTSKVSPEARAFGHLYEAIALIEREKRCHQHWMTHREASKQFIAESIAYAKKKNAVLVLGSGPLHEIPIDILAKQFGRVDLVDMVHLKSTKDGLAFYKNIRFIEADVTELEAEILKHKTIVHQPPTRFLNEKYDLVISANLLSQLSYHIKGFLEKKAEPKLSEQEIEDFSYKVSLDHVQYLQKFACPVVLITDVETNLLNAEEKVIGLESPYIDFPLPSPKRDWWWNVAPIPEYSKTIAIKMKVAAFLLNV
jgi:hypothetical protein